MNEIKAYKKSLPFFFSPLNILGIVFLCNPVFGVVDILPDAIGALCLWLGLTELSFTDSRIETARSRFLGLAAITGIKLVFTPTLTRGVVSSDTLAATAFFGVIEALLLILAFGSLFEGLSYSVTRRGSTSSLKVFEGSKVLTFVFIFARIGLNILPELSAIFELAAVNDITNAEMFLRIAALKNYFHLLNGFVILILGIWWAINTTAVFGRLKKDLTFVKDLSASYGDGYSKNAAIRVSTWFKYASRIFMFSLIFFFTLDFYEVSVLPNFAGTVILLIAVAVMGSPLKKRLYKKFKPLTLLYVLAVQIGAYVFRALFVDITINFFGEIVWWQVGVCAVIGGLEFYSFVLLAKMCHGIFLDYVKFLCGEKTVSLMYSPNIAVCISGAFYFIGYVMPILRGYLVIPQILALIAVGAVVNANVNFVRGSVESGEDNSHLCADL